MVTNLGKMGFSELFVYSCVVQEEMGKVFRLASYRVYFIALVTHSSTSSLEVNQICSLEADHSKLATKHGIN